MSHWQRRHRSDEAWRYLLDVVRPDVALVQEAVPPTTPADGLRLLWEEVPGRDGCGAPVS
jgi:hypothetical protein